MRSLKLLYIFLVLPIAHLVAQNSDSAGSNRNKVLQFEKAYVQFDNNKYAPGQTIWYKAYLLTGIQPSLLSKTFYIDWYDDKGQLIYSTISPIVYCYASGSFEIPKKYLGKLIHAIAYTKYMRNFEASSFFQKSFQIVYPETLQQPPGPSLKEITIQFLPESGILLANKPNMVAFKAVNNRGLPESIHGIIINSKGDSVTAFKSIHDGMGKFQLKPLENENYFALWADETGKQYKTSIPATDAVGVSLIVDPGSGSRIFHIQRPSNSPERLQQLTLIGQMYGNIVFKAKVDLTKSEAVSSSLPINKLSSGILQLTVLDANMKPICERILFNKTQDYLLHATIKFDSINTSKRGKNVLEIALQDSSYTNLSLSVTDANTNNIPDNNIISQLLLQSDLKGPVYRPSYYFKSEADTVSNHLDLVMLTNGWRRYNWDYNIDNSFPDLKYPRDSNYQSIYGKITDYTSRKNKPADSINLVFSSKDSSNYMVSLPINVDGSFSIKDIMLSDSVNVFYKSNNKAIGAKMVSLIDNDFFKPDQTISMQRFNYWMDTTGLKKFKNSIENQSKAEYLNQKNTLKEVIVMGKEKSSLKALDSKYTFGVFSTEPAAAFDMSTLENASHTNSIFDFLTGKVPGLVIGGSLGGTATEGIVEYRGGTPSFYLNERYIPSSELGNIDMNTIAYIKVFSPPFAGGSSESVATIATNEKGSKTKMVNAIPSSAAIAIYTKKGRDIITEESALKSYTRWGKLIAGYTPHKEFYVPPYADSTQAQPTADFRTTLLWHPWINLDKKNHIVRIRFYNNDVSKSFRLTLDGMDGRGKLIHLDKIIE